MNLQKILFKAVVTFTYLLRCWVLILPVAVGIVVLKEEGWKYGFTFIQSNANVAFFVSFALSFLIALYHTLSFEEAEGAPDQNYLKAHQEVRVRADFSMDSLENWMANHPKFCEIVRDENQITASKKVYFLKPDRVYVRLENEIFIVQSKPYFKWWFIDFARNYKTVKSIAKTIKNL